MASSSSPKRFLSASNLPSSLRLPRPTTFTVAPPAFRLFNTKASGDDARTFTVVPSASRLFKTKDFRDQEEGEDSSDREHFFPGSLLIDPTLLRRSSPTGLGVLFSDGMQDRIWRQVKVSDLITRETDDALQLRMDMPGLGKEEVKVWMEQDDLVISGSESEDGVAGGYSAKIHLPEKAYKTDEVKAEMKNGVLKVTVPKVKEEDRKDVIHISVE